jgi:hypothetical protein
MTTPQNAIFALGTASHAYLEFDRRDPAQAGDLVNAVASLREPRTTMGGVNLVAGFRPDPAATHTRIELARALLARNSAEDRGRAEELLDRALVDAEQIGMAGALEAGRALRTNAGSREQP